MMRGRWVIDFKEETYLSGCKQIAVLCLKSLFHWSIGYRAWRGVIVQTGWDTLQIYNRKFYNATFPILQLFYGTNPMPFMRTRVEVGCLRYLCCFFLLAPSDLPS